MSQHEVLFRTGKRHIEEPALLLQVREAPHHIHRREKIVFQTGNQHVPELQALRRMHGHKGHPVGIIPFIRIRICEQGYIFEIVTEGDIRHILPVLLRLSGSLIHINGNGVEKLLHICLARHSFDGCVGSKAGAVAALVSNPERELLGIAPEGVRGKAVYHPAEILDFCNGGRAQSEAFQVIEPGRLE